jgi:hypothetical protein
MKLLFCPHCNDVFSLNTKGRRSCSCGLTYGEYTDDINATISSTGVALGFANGSFTNALREHIRNPKGIPVKGRYFDNKGHDFTAFTIPEDAPSVKREGPCVWLDEMLKTIGPPV